MIRRTLTASGLILCLLAPATLRSAEAVKGDKDLDGDWEAVSMIRDGKEGKPPGENKMVVTIKGDAITFKQGDDDHKGTIKVDTSKTPKTMDLMPEDGPAKGKTLVGVYEIKGDELRVCHGEPGKDRPAELSSKEGSGLMLITFKRVKK